MATTAERFYDEMDSLQALQGLIGQPETADFDCKEWPERQDAARGSLAKAACGFANATGGVILIGVKASGRGADTPDVVRSLVPVKDRQAVLSAALDIILKFVEPGIQGIRAKTISDVTESTPSGFVAILIPEAEGSVRRSKQDWRFYVRVASGTLPMEYFQIEERFGRRPAPRLSLVLEQHQIVSRSGYNDYPLRHLYFGLKNEGRGIAKFPGIRFRYFSGLKNNEFGVDGNGGYGLPPRASEYSWIVFRGGVDDVIYPDEVRMISMLVQPAVKREERPLIRPGHPFFGDCERIWVCEPHQLHYEISAEGVATKAEVYQLEESNFIEPFKTRV